MHDATGSATATVERPSEETQGSTILEVLAADARFLSFAGALRLSGLEELLRGEGPFTVFVPTDEAFTEMPEGAFESQTFDKVRMARLVGNHIVSDQLLAADLLIMAEADARLSLPTVNGRETPVRLNGTTVHIGDRSSVTIVTPDLMASNGVVHAVDGILAVPS